MPDTIIGIGNSSFYKCAIKSITLGPKVEILDTHAFQFSKLEIADLSKTKIKVPQGIYHFWGTNLKTILLSDCMELLPHFFLALTKITELTFPRNLKSIEVGALACIPELKVLKSNCPDIVIYRRIAYSSDFKTLIKCPVDFNEPLAPTIVNISDCGAFSSCKFVSFVLDPQVQKLGGRMFRACLLLQSVDLSKSIATELPFEIFYDCKKLTNLILPDTVNSISGSIFFNGKIINFKIPPSVKYLDPNTFLSADVGTIEYCGLYLLNVTAPSNSILKTNTIYPNRYFLQQTTFSKELTGCFPERTPFPTSSAISKHFPSCLHNIYSFSSFPSYLLFVLIIS